MNETKHVKDAIGPHEIWFEPDTGFIGVVQVGTLDGAHATSMVEHLAEYAKRSGGATFVIGDDRRAMGLTREARSVFVSSDVVRSECHVALFGASFAFRAVVNLFVKALTLTGSKFVIHAEADEAKARAWLAEQRRAYLARSAKG